MAGGLLNCLESKFLQQKITLAQLNSPQLLVCSFLGVKGGLLTMISNTRYIRTLIGCNMAARGLTDIYTRSQGHAAPEGECGYISKTPSMSVLQCLSNIFNSCVLHCS